ncbi:type II secretion system F family protein [Planctomicrobium sp.]|jgi:tight adherence protein C|nr:type II secretion system F family protein [Planctomicrobium sp.]MBT5021086.1 type II secretion system F family protein [Planctomicrobium sp.]MDA7527498.1 type II secretion system F family protein [bacterium]MDB4732976.1 type II secretion system F family protein [Planctomicrobium sp.]
MNSSQQIFLISAIAIAVLVYGIYKSIQLRKKSVSSKSPGPKMRPKGTSSIQPGVPSESKVVANSIQKTETATVQKTTDFIDSKAASVTQPVTSKSTPKQQSTEKSSFDQIEEEYPYFGQDDYTFGSLTPVIAAMMPSTPEGRVTLTRSLRNAGYYSPHAWHNMTAIRYLLMMGPIVFFGFMLVIAPPQLETLAIIAMIVTAIFGWALPPLYVRSKAADRLREISNAMPDMLDLLNMCVSQGMTVTSALGRVGRDIEPVYPALGKELKIVKEQAHVGSLDQSLTNLSERVDLPEVHSFSSLLVQTDRMGTSVSEALAEYSDNMRESMKQRADEKANSATFKLLFPTVLCLMPAVYLFLLGPAIVELNRFYEDGGSDVFRTEIPAEYTGG